METQRREQVTLAWPGTCTARDFRTVLGGALIKEGHGPATEWLFHRQDGIARSDDISPARFFHTGKSVGITIIGDENVARLEDCLGILMRTARGIGYQNPSLRHGVIWAEQSEYPVGYMASRIVLRKLRLENSEHPPVDVLIQHLKEAVAKSLCEQALMLGLDPLPLVPEDIQVYHVDELGSTQVTGANDGVSIIPRLTRAVFTIPYLLEGNWAVGGLLSHGNGFMMRVDKLKQIRARRSNERVPA